METDNIKQIERVKERLERGVFSHPDLDVVCLGGSNSSNSAGRLSDIDITTLMKPENPRKVDINSILQLGSQIRRFTFEQSQGNIIVIVISTIRLEEAQIAMAELINPGKTIIPIHWLHYPSAEFAAINEPSKLIEGLLKGRAIQGNPNKALVKIQSTDIENFGCLAGIDWLTDSFRVFISNINSGEFSVKRQSDSFLKKLAPHNLEYFWKWNIIRKAIENKTSLSTDNWVTMEQMSEVIPNTLWKTAMEVRQLRYKGEWANTSEVIDIHAKTFEIIFENQ